MQIILSSRYCLVSALWTIADSLFCLMTLNALSCRDLRLLGYLRNAVPSVA